MFDSVPRRELCKQRGVAIEKPRANLLRGRVQERRVDRESQELARLPGAIASDAFYVRPMLRQRVLRPLGILSDRA